MRNIFLLFLFLSPRLPNYQNATIMCFLPWDLNPELSAPQPSPRRTELPFRHTRNT